MKPKSKDAHAGDSFRAARCAVCYRAAGHAEPRYRGRHRHARHRTAPRSIRPRRSTSSPPRTALRRRRQRRTRAGAGESAAVVEFPAPVERRRRRHGARGAAARPVARPGAGAGQRQAPPHLGAGRTPNRPSAAAPRRSTSTRSRSGAISASKCCATAPARSTARTPSPASSTSSSTMRRKAAKLSHDLRRIPHQFQAEATRPSPMARPVSSARRSGRQLGGDGGFLRAGIEANRQRRPTAPVSTNPLLAKPDAGRSRPGKASATTPPATRNWRATAAGSTASCAVRRKGSTSTPSARTTSATPPATTTSAIPTSGRTCRRSIRDGYRPESLGNNRDSRCTGRCARQARRMGYDASLTYGRNAFDYGLRDSLNARSAPRARPLQHRQVRIFSRTVANLDFKPRLDIGAATDTFAAGAEARHEDFQT